MIGSSTISMQSHGAVARASVIQPGAKYRHCSGSASFFFLTHTQKRGGGTDAHLHAAVNQCHIGAE